MRNRKSAIIVILVAFGFSVVGIVGCGVPSDVGINPFEYLTLVNSVDHTDFFIEIYGELLRTELVDIPEETQAQ